MLTSGRILLRMRNILDKLPHSCPDGCRIRSDNSMMMKMMIIIIIIIVITVSDIQSHSVKFRIKGNSVTNRD
jgi:hypothetical protein